MICLPLRTLRGFTLSDFEQQQSNDNGLKSTEWMPHDRKRGSSISFEIKRYRKQSGQIGKDRLTSFSGFL